MERDIDSSMYLTLSKEGISSSRKEAHSLREEAKNRLKEIPSIKLF